MQVARCFRPRGSVSRIPGSRGLVGGPLPTPYRKPYCYKYPLTPTLHYCRRLQIVAALLSSRPPAPSLYCFAPAETCGKRHGSFIVLAVRVYKLRYPLGAKLKNAQKTSPPASDCI